MTLQGLFFVAVYFAGLLATFYKPAYGVYTYIFHWHNHPPYYWWGKDLPDLRWSLLIALATLVSYFMHRSKLDYQHKPKIPTMTWLILFAANMVMVSEFFAILPDESMPKAVELVKICISYALMISIIRKHSEYELLTLVLVFCIAKMGFTAFEVGRNRDVGVLAPNATEENAISAHVACLMPFFVIAFLRGQRWLKIAVALSIPLCLNLLILANSRAAVMSLVAIGALSAVLFKGKIRFAIIAAGIVMAFVFSLLTNDAFEERQTTDVSDNSAQSRFRIWAGGFEMWKDHPMGVGGGGFAYLSEEYVEDIKGPKTQHNTFVAIYTDWGFLGIIFYLIFLTVTYLLTIKIKFRGKFHPALEKYRIDATSIQLALVGFAAAGLTHSRQYAEAVYWMSAFAVMLDNMQRTEIYYLENGLDPETGQPPLQPQQAIDQTVLAGYHQANGNA